MSAIALPVNCKKAEHGLTHRFTSGKALTVDGLYLQTAKKRSAQTLSQQLPLPLMLLTTCRFIIR